MLINRRTFLSVAAASSLAACRAHHELVDSGLPAVPPVPKLPNPPSSIVMLGDSITVGAKPILELVLTQMGFSAITIDAEKNRRIESSGGTYGPKAGTAVATFVVGVGPPPELWVIALGTNDAGQYKDAGEYRAVVDSMLAIIPRAAPLAWIDTYREDHLAGSELFNRVLREALATRGHAVVGDWYQRCAQPDARILGLDGVHPNKRGVLVFAETVYLAVRSVMASFPSK